MISLKEPLTASALVEVFREEEKEKSEFSTERIPHAVMISFFPHVQTKDDIITEAIFLIDRY